MELQEKISILQQEIDCLRKRALEQVNSWIYIFDIEIWMSFLRNLVTMIIN